MLFLAMGINSTAGALGQEVEMEAMVMAAIAAACTFLVYVFAHFLQALRELRRTAVEGSDVVRLGAGMSAMCEPKLARKTTDSRPQAILVGKETKIEAVL